LNTFGLRFVHGRSNSDGNPDLTFSTGGGAVTGFMLQEKMIAKE